MQSKNLLECWIANLDHFVCKIGKLVAAGLDHIKRCLGKRVPLCVCRQLQAQAGRGRLSIFPWGGWKYLMRVVRTPWYSSLRSKGFLSSQDSSCLTDSSTSATEAMTGATTTWATISNQFCGNKVQVRTCFSPAFTGFMHISLKRLRALQERRREMYWRFS